MRSAYVVLLAANLVSSTSYVATRAVLDDLPPALLALVQPIGGALLGVGSLTAFTVAGGALIVLGLWLTVTGRE